MTRIMVTLGLCASLMGRPALAAKAADPVEPPKTAQVLFLSSCPTDKAAGRPASAFTGILGVIGQSLLKGLVVKAADAFADSIDKRNQSLSAVSTFEGFGWFYGPDRLTANGEVKASDGDVLGCIVVARYGALSQDIKFTDKLKKAGADMINAAVVGPSGVAAGQKGPAYENDDVTVATPDFYAELKLEPAVLPDDGDPTTKEAAYGFRLKPSFVYFGKSQAKAEPDHEKSLRLEITLKRFQLDKGALADKAFYTGAFDLGRHKARVLLLPEATEPKENRLNATAGPLATYPLPADLKAGALRLVSSDGAALLPNRAVVDPAPMAAEAKLIEAQDPSLLAAAIAKALKDNKTKIEEAATSVALKVAAEITN